MIQSENNDHFLASSIDVKEANRLLWAKKRQRRAPKQPALESMTSKAKQRGNDATDSSYPRHHAAISHPKRQQYSNLQE